MLGKSWTNLLGFYPPKTPYMRPGCAQVATAAQTRVPACDCLSREAPLPTMKGGRQSADFFVFTSQPARAQLLKICKRKQKPLQTAWFSRVCRGKKVHHRVAHTLGSASAVVEKHLFREGTLWDGGAPISSLGAGLHGAKAVGVHHPSRKGIP